MLALIVCGAVLCWLSECSEAVLCWLSECVVELYCAGSLSVWSCIVLAI